MNSFDVHRDVLVLPATRAQVLVQSKRECCAPVNVGLNQDVLVGAHALHELAADDQAHPDSVRVVPGYVLPPEPVDLKQTAQTIRRDAHARVGNFELYHPVAVLHLPNHIYADLAGKSLLQSVVQEVYAYLLDFRLVRGHLDVGSPEIVSHI